MKIEKAFSFLYAVEYNRVVHKITIFFFQLRFTFTPFRYFDRQLIEVFFSSNLVETVERRLSSVNPKEFRHPVYLVRRALRLSCRGEAKVVLDKNIIG